LKNRAQDFRFIKKKHFVLFLIPATFYDASAPSCTRTFAFFSSACGQIQDALHITILAVGPFFFFFFNL